MQPQSYSVINLSMSSSTSRNYSRLQNLRQIQNNLVQEVYSDDQEKLKLQETVQEYYLRYQIRKAQIGGNKLDLLIVIHRFVFPGEVTAKIDAQRKWFVEYYEQGAHINIQNGYFSPRIDAGLCQNPGEIYGSQLLINGIDLLQTHDIINRFFLQNPKVSWINASHCLLTFENQQLLSQFFENQCANKPDYQNMQNRNNYPKWIQIRGYKFLNEFDRKIYARHYTQADKEYIATLAKDDELYQNFRRINKQLEFTLLKNEKIRKMFQQVISEDVVSKMIGPNSFRKRKKSTIEKMYGDRSSFIYQPKQPRKHRENNNYHYHQSRSRSPQHNQLFQNQQYRYSLDYYKKHFIPGLKNNKVNQMKAREKRKDPINNHVLEPVNLQSKMLQKKNKPNAEFNKISNELFNSPLFDQTEIVIPDQRQRVDMQASVNQEIDTSFHFDDAPQPAEKKSDLQNLLEQVVSHQNEQSQPVQQISNSNRNKESNLNLKNNSNNPTNEAFGQSFNRNPNQFWTNNNFSTNNYQLFNNKQSSSGSIGDLNSRFNRMLQFGSSNHSSIQERSFHHLNLNNNISFNTEGLSSNSLSHHNFSSNNSKQKMPIVNNVLQNMENSNRASSSSGLYSEWAESIASKERSGSQAPLPFASEHSQSETPSSNNNPFMQKIQGVKRQYLPFKGNNYKSFRSSYMKPAPASIPEVQTDLVVDNEKLQHFQSASRKNDILGFKFQPESQFSR